MTKVQSLPINVLALIGEFISLAVLGLLAHVALWGWIAYVQECCG